MNIPNNLEWMQVMALVVGLASCLVICWQDIRQRWVHLLPLLLLGCTGFVFKVAQPFPIWTRELAANWIFLIMILGVAWVYMRIRHGNAPFFNYQIGWGDVVFLAAAATWLSPLGFVLYFVTGSLILLLTVLILVALGSVHRQWPIPLAGMLSLYLILYWPLTPIIEDLFWRLLGG